MRLLTGISIAMLLASLLAPAVAPLVDHHFAERQPAHQHLGVPYHHVHVYGDGHAHVGSVPVDTDGNETAFYNTQAGLVGVTMVTTDKSMQTFLLFELTSTFSLPASSDTLARQAFTSPLDRPPRPRL